MWARTLHSRLDNVERVDHEGRDDAGTQAGHGFHRGRREARLAVAGRHREARASAGGQSTDVIPVGRSVMRVALSGRAAVVVVMREQTICRQAKCGAGDWQLMLLWGRCRGSNLEYS